MAKSYDNPTPEPSGPKKAVPKAVPTGSSPLAQAQRRAQTMASRKPTDPAQFFREAWVELKKTTWPNRDVLTKSTTVVLALVLAVAIWVGGLDAILTQVSTPLFTTTHK